jgi:hypothetical protein
MTIGIARADRTLDGPSVAAGAPCSRQYGSISGFATIAAIAADGEVLRHETQWGGASTLFLEGEITGTELPLLSPTPHWLPPSPAGQSSRSSSSCGPPIPCLASSLAIAARDPGSCVGGCRITLRCSGGWAL